MISGVPAARLASFSIFRRYLPTGDDAMHFEYRLGIQAFASQIPLSAMTGLAQEAMAAIDKGRFEETRRLIASKLVFGPDQRTLLEGLITGMSIADPSSVDAAKAEACLRHLDDWIAEYEAVVFPDVILTRSTWGATGWTSEERTSYFVHELGLCFYTNMSRRALSPARMAGVARYLKGFAENGSMEWPSDHALPPLVFEAMKIYDAARRKGATSSEIVAMAEAIASHVPGGAGSVPEPRKPVKARARSIYEDLVGEGYDAKAIIALATELIAEVTKSLATNQKT
jgi:hypothetical protein